MRRAGSPLSVGLPRYSPQPQAPLALGSQLSWRWPHAGAGWPAGCPSRRPRSLAAGPGVARFRPQPLAIWTRLLSSRPWWWPVHVDGVGGVGLAEQSHPVHAVAAVDLVLTLLWNRVTELPGRSANSAEISVLVLVSGRRSAADAMVAPWPLTPLTPSMLVQARRAKKPLLTPPLRVQCRWRPTPGRRAGSPARQRRCGCRSGRRAWRSAPG